MKKSIIKMFSVILVVILTLTSAPLSGFVGLKIPEWLDISIVSKAAEISGYCGNNLTWFYNTSTETLYISGTGVMWDFDDCYYYSNYTSHPWSSYEDDIKEIIIYNGVTSIGSYAFFTCSNLKSVTIGNSVTSIGERAFWQCESLTSIAIPDSLTEISETAFLCCDSLTGFIVDNDNNYFSNDENGVLFNNDKTVLIQYPIGNIRTSYTIPDSVTKIGNWAFFTCSNLTSVIIGDSVTIIGEHAFSSCNGIKSVIIPNSVTNIAKDAFGFCDNLTSVTIGDSVTIIGEDAFRACEKLAKVTIPNSVVSIENYAFSFCSSLTSVTIPKSVSTIGERAFSFCSSLTVYYPGTKVHWNNILIGDDAFYFTSVTFKYNYCEHNYQTIVIQSTCTSQGYTTYTCSACGDTYTNDYVDALGHTAGEIVEENYIAPTCLVEGSKDNVTYCTVCGVETSRKEIIIDALGHTEEVIPAVAPTCTKTGLTAGVKCSACDEILTAQQELLANGHKYESVVTTPTCTEQGYTTYMCACGDSYVDDYTDTLGHDFKNGTCTECDATDPDYFTFEIQNPSRTTIRCNDGIKLHTSVTGNLPEGSRIEWSKNNSNFNVSVSDSGNEITIVSKNNGYTTFTATVYDADNKVIAEDAIEIYSKASFFDKIGGFFRLIFGGTTIYEN